MYLARLRLCNFVLLSIITISKISISYNCNQYKDMSPTEFSENIVISQNVQNEGTPKRKNHQK